MDFLFLVLKNVTAGGWFYSIKITEVKIIRIVFPTTVANCSYAQHHELCRCFKKVYRQMDFLINPLDRLRCVLLLIIKHDYARKMHSENRDDF